MQKDCDVPGCPLKGNVEHEHRFNEENYVVLEICTCASIMAKDHTRHFRGCPLRGKYPTHEAEKLSDKPPIRWTPKQLVEAIDHAGFRAANNLAHPFLGPTEEDQLMLWCKECGRDSGFHYTECSHGKRLADDWAYGLKAKAAYTTTKRCGATIPMYVDLYDEKLTCTKLAGHDGAHWAKGKYNETSWPDEGFLPGEFASELEKHRKQIHSIMSSRAESADNWVSDALWFLLAVTHAPGEPALEARIEKLEKPEKELPEWLAKESSKSLLCAKHRGQSRCDCGEQPTLKEPGR
jgi:hypothetical protein